MRTDDAMVPTVDQFKKITLPILTITGQYDGDELGAMTFYRDHIANASPETRAKHFLNIGPWDRAARARRRMNSRASNSAQPPLLILTICIANGTIG